MIGKIINEIRKKRGISLSELAERAKISKSYLSNIERNINQNPSIHVMKKIAIVLDVDLNSLIITEQNNSIRDTKQDNEWQEFVNEMKDLKIEKDQISEFKSIIDYIKWKNQIEDNNRKTRVQYKERK